MVGALDSPASEAMLASMRSRARESLRLLAVAAVAPGCGLDVLTVVPDPAIALIAVVGTAGDGEIRGLTGLLPADMISHVGVPRDQASWIVGWSLATFSEVPLPANQISLRDSVVDPATPCDPSLPIPNFAARVQGGAAFAAAPAEIPRLTTAWLRDTCPGGDAPLVDVRCIPGGLPTRPIRQGCRFALDFPAALSGPEGSTLSLAGALMPSGDLCIEPSRGRGCAPSVPDPAPIVSATCDTSHGACPITLELPGTLTASVVVTSVYRDVLPLPPIARRALGMNEARRGYLGDLVATADQLLVVGYGGREANFYCSGITESWLHFFDPPSLREVATASVSGCLRRVYSGPSSGELFGLLSRPGSIEIARLEATGQHRSVGSIPTKARNWVAGAARGDNDGWVFAVASYDGDGDADLILASAASDLSGLRVVATIPGADPQSIARSADGMILVSSESTHGVLAFRGDLSFDAIPLAQTLDARAGEVIALPDGGAALGVLGLPGAVHRLDAATRTLTEGGSYFEDIGIPTGMVLDPAHRARLLVGLAVQNADLSWSARVARFDLDKRRFIAGSVSVGSSPPVRLISQQGSVFGIEPRSAELFRLTLEGS